MGTIARSVISEKNEFWIPHYKYLELLNFCKQYPEWKKDYILISGYKNNYEYSKIPLTYEISNRTEDLALKKQALYEKIQLLQDTAKEVDPIYWNYILKGITENYTYEYLKLQLNIPYCRTTYYRLYRKFFWILSKKR